jgi:hypothetical protein
MSEGLAKRTKARVVAPRTKRTVYPTVFLWASMLSSAGGFFTPTVFFILLAFLWRWDDGRCRHSRASFLRDIYSPATGGMRSWWQCSDCGTFEARDEVEPESPGTITLPKRTISPRLDALRPTLNPCDSCLVLRGPAGRETRHCNFDREECRTKGAPEARPGAWECPACVTLHSATEEVRRQCTGRAGCTPPPFVREFIEELAEELGTPMRVGPGSFFVLSPRAADAPTATGEAIGREGVVGYLHDRINSLEERERALWLEVEGERSFHSAAVDELRKLREEVYGLRKAYDATRANLAAECGECVDITAMGDERRQFQCTGRGRACSAKLANFQRVVEDVLHKTETSL